MFSVVIPALNEEKYLPFLLSSLKKQALKDLAEIIVADGGSEDKTQEIAKNYGCEVVSGGLPAAGRNNGAKVAEGELILFLDADIILAENFLEKILKEFKERNLDIASFALGCSQKFHPVRGNPAPSLKGRDAAAPLARRISNGVYDLSYKIFYNIPSFLTEKFLPQAMSTILVKSDIHHKIGGFDEEIKIGEELDYVRRGAKIGKYGFFKKSKIFASPRRFQKDGWFLTWLKYFLCQLHMLFLGPVKSDILKYRFGYSQKLKNEV